MKTAGTGVRQLGVKAAIVRGGHGGDQTSLGGAWQALPKRRAGEILWQDARVMMREMLAERADSLGLSLETQQWERLETLGGLWRRYGRSMNILGKGSAGGIAEQIWEGLGTVRLAGLLAVTDRPRRWLDVGSGGGYPGLVLASCLELELVLVEPRAKRAAFLEMALARLGRQDCVVRRGRIGAGRQWEALDGRGLLAGGFDVADARAVFAPEVWLPVGASWADGYVLAHLPGGAVEPLGIGAVARVEGGSWSIRGYSVRDVSRGT